MSSAEDVAVAQTQPQEVHEHEHDHDHSPAAAVADRVNIKVKLPSSKVPVELSIFLNEQVRDIRRYVCDQNDLHFTTCCYFEHEGEAVDDHITLAEVPNVASGSLFSLRDGEYNEHEVTLHVRQLQSLMGSEHDFKSFVGANLNSPSILTTILSEPENTLNLLNAEDVKPSQPPTSLPELSAVRLDQFIPVSMQQAPPTGTKAIDCLHVLRYSGWNPVPSARRLQGDILYLEVVTLEGSSFCITAAANGFFVNKSNEKTFNPARYHKQAPVQLLSVLLGQISPMFRKNIALVLERARQRQPLETISTNFHVVQTFAPDHTVHYYDSSRIDGSKQLNDGPVPRDYNETRQMLADMEAETDENKILQHKQLFRLHSSFVSSVREGAVEVMLGNRQAIFPEEAPDARMFLRDSIFYSWAVDARASFTHTGGNETAHKAATADLRGVAQLQNATMNTPIHVLTTSVVDFMGRRCVAQGVIPGILNRTNLDHVIYSSIDNGKTVACNEQLHSALEPICENLSLKTHKVLDGEGKEHEIRVSLECKGVRGTDDRSYLMDLSHIFLPDANFVQTVTIPAETDGGEPRTVHVVTNQLLRPELVETYVEQTLNKAVRTKYADILAARKTATEAAATAAAAATTAEGATSQGAETVADPAAASQLTEEDRAKLTLTKEELDALNLSFNPDVFSLVRLGGSAEDITADEQRVRDLAEYLVNVVIPSFVEAVNSGNALPLDTFSLSKLLHGYGINVRYIGQVYKLFQSKGKSPWMQTLLLSDMIVRAAKYCLWEILSNTTLSHAASTVATFLNSMFGNRQEVTEPVASNKKQSAESRYTFTSQSVWTAIVAQIKKRFNYELDTNSLSGSAAIAHLKLGSIPLLRAFCRRLGIQLALKNFDFTVNAPFSAADVLHLEPVLKHIPPRFPYVNRLLEVGVSRFLEGSQALVRLEQGIAERVRQAASGSTGTGTGTSTVDTVADDEDVFSKATEAEQKLAGDLSQVVAEGHGCMREALATMEGMYGYLHEDLAHAYHTVGSVMFKCENHELGISHVKRAIVVMERVQGLDNFSLTKFYVTLGLMLKSVGRLGAALTALMHARTLLHLICPPDHPELASCSTHIAMLLLESSTPHDRTVSFLQEALDTYVVAFGNENNIRCIEILNALGYLYRLKQNTKESLLAQKRAAAAAEALYGPDHTDTKTQQFILQQYLNNSDLTASDRTALFARTLAMNGGHGHPTPNQKKRWAKKARSRVNKITKEAPPSAQTK